MAFEFPADARQAEARVRIETEAFIDGRFAPSASGKTFSTINPANGRTFRQVSECDVEDVDRAVRAARAAFEDGRWSGLSPLERKKILLRMADLLEGSLEEFAILETLDSGKPLTDSLSIDLPDSIETLRWHAEAIDKIYDQISPTKSNVVSMIIREPVGVVGAVLPWNFPLFMAMWKLAPALASGNSLLIKPAEQTSLTALRLAELAVSAGIPPGVLNVVPGFGETAGQAIGRHKDIDCVSFTGSGEVGRMFLRYSSESNLKKIVLECGGKSPAIVMSDATDIEAAAKQITTGILFCQGENCSAGSRLIVHRDIKTELLAALTKSFSSWPVGDPLDAKTKVGALIEEKHLDRVMSYIAEGRRQGAEVILGGKRLYADSGGYFVAPTIFDHVRNDMVIAQDEIFGPVLSVIEFTDVDEAIKIANDSRYGLAASLYTNSLKTAHQVARRLKAGTVSVNCYSEGDMAAPFGGYKESGFGGRDKSLMAHDQYVETKSIWMQLA